MLAIADIMQPCRANLLVRRDVPTDVVGVGLEGKSLVRAERYQQRPNTGLVVKRGDQAPACFSPGTWLIWGDGAATALAMGGEREMVLVNSQYVLAWTRQGWGAEADPLADEATIPFLQAPPGAHLVERLEMPVQRGRIIIPDGINLHTRSSEATVIASGLTCLDFWPGDTVFLAGSVSRSFWVGHRRLWVVTPQQIPAKLLPERPDVALAADEGTTAGMQDFTMGLDADAALDEGDPRSPR